MAYVMNSSMMFFQIKAEVAKQQALIAEANKVLRCR